jgi:S1-C subfamily serine protease
MPQQLERSVIRILDPEGATIGAGFVVADGLAVTCAHVVEAAGAGSGGTITIAFALTSSTSRAEVLADAWHPPDGNDIAILRLQSKLPPGVKPVVLGPSQNTGGHPFRAFGYPHLLGDEPGDVASDAWAYGTILGIRTPPSGVKKLQLRTQEIVQGMSGAPVLDTDDDRVVGMVTATYYNPDGTLKFRDMSFATPIEMVVEIRPSLELVPPSRPSFQRPPLGVPFQSPSLPAHFVPRPEVTDAIKARLLSKEPTMPGILVVSAIHGLGGIGKSTLVAALAHDPEVQATFSDGILWATLGQQPDLLSLLSGWIQELRDYDFRPTTVEAASAHLRTLLQDKSILLVVDDVWDLAHALPFRVGSPKCQVLITTRRADVAEEVGAVLYQMDVMTPQQSLDLLSSRLGRLLAEWEHKEALRLAEAVGHLPLALELAAVRVGRGSTWVELCEALEEEVARLEALETPRHRRRGHTRLEATFNLSLNALRADDEKAWQAFVWLGVLPEDMQIAAPMATTLWDMTKTDTCDMLELLWNDALLLPGAPVVFVNRKEAHLLIEKGTT